MVAPKDPLTSLGWKTYGDCMINLDDEMVNCVEENAYSAQDVFISNENNKFNPIYEKGKIACYERKPSGNLIKKTLRYIFHSTTRMKV